MPASDYVPSLATVGRHAAMAAQEGAHRLVFGRRWQHRIVDVVLQNMMQAFIPAIGVGLVGALPTLLGRRAEMQKLTDKGERQLHERLDQKLSKAFELHLKLEPGDGARKLQRAEASQVFVQSLDQLVAAKLAAAKTGKEIMTAYQQALRCLKDEGACGGFAASHARDARTAYANLPGDLQAFADAALAETRRDYRVWLRRAACVAALLSTLAAVYYLTPESASTADPGAALAAAAAAGGKSPADLEAIKADWQAQNEALSQELAQEQEARLQEQAALRKQLDEAEKARNAAAAAQLAADQESVEASIRSLALMRAQMQALQLQNGNADQYKTFLQQLMPNSLMGLLVAAAAATATVGGVYTMKQARDLRGAVQELGDDVRSARASAGEIQQIRAQRRAVSWSWPDVSTTGLPDIGKWFKGYKKARDEERPPAKPVGESLAEYATYIQTWSSLDKATRQTVIDRVGREQPEVVEAFDAALTAALNH